MAEQKTQLCLVRHGQTDWNLEGRYQGHADTPLNPTGFEQARRLAEVLRAGQQRFAAVYCSDLLRACQTATILAEALDLPQRTDRRLREVDQGEWEGLHISELTRRFAAVLARRKAEPLTTRPPGGESLGELAGRARAAADEIARAHPGQAVLVVAHGLTLAALIALARGLPLAGAYSLIPPNTTPVFVAWPPDGSGAPGREEPDARSA